MGVVAAAAVVMITHVSFRQHDVMYCRPCTKWYIALKAKKAQLKFNSAFHVNTKPKQVRPLSWWWWWWWWWWRWWLEAVVVVVVVVV